MDFEPRRDLGDTLAMTHVLRPWLLVCAAFVLAGCDTKRKSAPKIAVAPLKCTIDPNNPGPLRRGGRANIEIEGHGVEIKASKVNAWCGPLFNTDVPALNIKAGQGLLFEACLPDGMVQVSAFDRPKPGTQDLHSADQALGVEVLFNQNGGPSYSSRGAEDDRVVLSNNLWKASAEVELRDIATGAKIEAKLSFDCNGFKTGAPLAPRTLQDAGVAAAKDAGVTPAKAADTMNKPLAPTLPSAPKPAPKP